MLFVLVVGSPPFLYPSTPSLYSVHQAGVGVRVGVGDGSFTMKTNDELVRSRINIFSLRAPEETSHIFAVQG